MYNAAYQLRALFIYLYHDKGVDWGTNVSGEARTLGYDTWEVAIGGQYQCTKKIAVSMGYLRTDMGITKQFQSDFSYCNAGDTFGGGFEWKPLPRFTVDAGVLYTIYKDTQKPFTDPDPAIGSYSETYSKHNLGFALGLGYHFGGILIYCPRLNSYQFGNKMKIGGKTNKTYTTFNYIEYVYTGL